MASGWARALAGASGYNAAESCTLVRWSCLAARCGDVGYDSNRVARL